MNQNGHSDPEKALGKNLGSLVLYGTIIEDAIAKRFGNAWTPRLWKLNQMRGESVVVGKFLAKLDYSSPLRDIHPPPLHPPPLQILGLILGLGAG